MKLLKNIVVFSVFLILAFIVVICWEKASDLLPFGGAGSVMYGVGCLVLFIVLYRKRGVLKNKMESETGTEEHEEPDPGPRDRRLEQIRKSIRERKKQEGKSLI